MSLWRLIRGEHGVLAALASASSYVVAGDADINKLMLLAISTFLAEAGLFAHNDLSNIEEDRVNRPNAPLVTGAVSINTARVVAYGTLATGVVLAAFLGLTPLAVYAVAVALGLLYNAKLKRVPVVGNLIVAFLTSMTYIYGMTTAGNMSTVLLLLFTSSLVANLGREFVKTAIDYEGDMKSGIKTLAVITGPYTTAKLGAAITLASTAFGWALAYVAAFEKFYVLAAGAAATSLTLVYLSLEAARGRWKKYRDGTLAAFGITLLALVIEALWRLYS
ncbi:UbiA prenyltransferase [Pyrobaculum islandicum DSM 4184]|uniref:UbiA prenyltransferase n=1 Tax=Pyrobaculum islandicum (strain DSM 4184 / JCM 9189 / GEO3) TaxID=384616 RepID=A1RVA2_PYRIL|nr:geranylgeranylglycerol-phosphate geranylgeranyltransferase [Pyrobaculum islandicum]ABL88884.1 UbiA prenyltransferase [Pyrobaculum islandicum DSM 4184]